MKQEDDKIRECLIALLCVGDTIRHLSTNRPAYTIDTLGTQAKPLNIIAEYKIAAIRDNNNIRIRTSSVEFDQDINDIHQHEGILYVCNTLNWYGDDEYERFLAELALFIQSAYTIHVK